MGSFHWCWAALICCVYSCNSAVSSNESRKLDLENGIFLNDFWSNYYGEKYRYFSEDERLKSKKDAQNMFYFAYDSYIKYAFPYDELNPIACMGRGPDLDDP